jgi:hypothetical protein
MKKIITFLFSVGLVSAVFAQTGDRNRNDSRDSRGNTPPSSYPTNDQYGYPNQYSNDDQYNRNSQWDGRGRNDRFARERQRKERQRYEMMMMRRNQERYNRQRRYNDYSPYGQSRGPVLQIRIGSGQSRY